MIVRLHNFTTTHESDVRIEVASAGVNVGVRAPIRIFDAVTLKEVARCTGRFGDEQWRQIGAGLSPTGPGYTYCDIEEQA